MDQYHLPPVQPRRSAPGNPPPDSNQPYPPGYPIQSPPPHPASPPYFNPGAHTISPPPQPQAYYPYPPPPATAPTTFSSPYQSIVAATPYVEYDANQGRDPFEDSNRRHSELSLAGYGDPGVNPVDNGGHAGIEDEQGALLGGGRYGGGGYGRLGGQEYVDQVAHDEFGGGGLGGGYAYERRDGSGGSVGYSRMMGESVAGGLSTHAAGAGDEDDARRGAQRSDMYHPVEGTDDELPSDVRYGKIPQRQPRRYKTVKRVQLYHGNLVLDCPVPPKLLEQFPKRPNEETNREFTHMRYTAVTCDPDHFEAERYTLRQALYGMETEKKPSLTSRSTPALGTATAGKGGKSIEKPRHAELYIVLTMYNEDEELFFRTMSGVVKNIEHLCTRERSKTWGADSWKKVTVVIVSDGRAKVNSRTLSVLAAMGVYQDGVAKNSVAGKPVTAHLYEYTTQVLVDPTGSKGPKTKPTGVPVQILFCLKEKNAKKINSHRWFFNAFGPILKPNICVLLDVGTQPGPKSIYKLWKCFDLNSNVGGACGEIVTLKGRLWVNLLNPLVAAQNFEYKMSNILDKPLESVFGYITVLPGAFSAYRWIALQNDAATGEGPLKEYFKGETLHHSRDADLWTKNMYLAEDRILCWELVAKRKAAWLLYYQRSAYAITDVPDRVPDLISQRRRWLNGSFFAGIHSMYHFGYLYRSDHSFMRKFLLHIELFYQTFNMIFAWFALGNWFITFVILTQSLADPSFGVEWIKYINTVLLYYYAALLLTSFVLALGNRPAASSLTYKLIMISYAIITAYMTAAAIVLVVLGIQNAANAVQAGGGAFSVNDIFSNSIFRNIVLSLLSTYGLYLLASLVFLDPAHMFTSFLQYLALAPSYINVINVYAFCNVQDVTWGNRPEEKPSNDLGKVDGAKDGVVDVAIVSDPHDINAAYDDALAVLSTKALPDKAPADPELKMTDSYRALRTNVVLAWTITNGALVAGILSTSAGSNITASGGSATVNGYMTFLLYSVAGLAAFRFIGCTAYSIQWLFQQS